MTYEEAIEKLRDECEQNNLEYDCRMQGCTECGFHMAIEALEKADKYKWHDLRKNPNDLPNDILIEYIVNLRWGEYCIATYSYSNYFSDAVREFTVDDVIAWKEIEPFEEES